MACDVRQVLLLWFRRRELVLLLYASRETLLADRTGILRRRDCPPARDTTIANALRPSRPLPAPHAVSFRSGRGARPWAVARFALPQRNRRGLARLIPRWDPFPWVWSRRERVLHA